MPFFEKQMKNARTNILHFCFTICNLPFSDEIVSPNVIADLKKKFKKHAAFKVASS